MIKGLVKLKMLVSFASFLANYTYLHDAIKSGR